jgi:hypothetical protein
MIHFLLSRCLQAASVVLALWALPIGSSFANPVGDLDIHSGGLVLSSQMIDFTSVAPTGTFAGLAGTTVVTADLNTAVPTVPNFITFAASPGLTITSNSLSAGVFSSASCGAAPAVGQTCTLPGSPLNFVNTVSGVTASFTVQGTLINAAGLQTPVTGVYTMQFAETNYQTVVATVQAGGTVRTSYSAEFTAATAGTFQFGGSVGLSSSGIDFNSSTVVGSTLSAANAFTVADSSTGTFVALPGTFGLAQDLPMLTGAFNISNFMLFAAAPSVSGSLTFVSPGFSTAVQCTAAPAPGQTCTLPNSPLTFVNVADGSMASFDVSGPFNDFTGFTPYTGLFSFQFAGMSYQQVLSTLLAGGSVAALYSASFDAGTPTTVSVPEPGTWLLLAVALTALGVVRRAGYGRRHRA